MRAVLLAAGVGIRLRPLTNRLPKCLMPVAGRPLLGHWLDLLGAHGIDEVLVNTHHLAERVEAYIARHSTPPAVTLTHEPEMLGSAGTLRRNRAFIGGRGTFVVGYADTLIHADVGALVRAHRELRERAGVLATLGLFRAPEPGACGIAELGADGVIARFVEKPAEPASDLAFAGLMVAEPALLDEMPDTTPADLGGDVLPELAGRMGGCILDGYVRDIGSLLSYAEAQLDFALAGEARA